MSAPLGSPDRRRPVKACLLLRGAVFAALSRERAHVCCKHGRLLFLSCFFPPNNYWELPLVLRNYSANYTILNYSRGN